jgi:transposase
MNKSTFFTGQPIFSQLIKYLPASTVNIAVRRHRSDHYTKKLNSYHHLITMLYCCYQQCTSLREVVSGMGACEGRLQSLGLNYLPARSTLSEANKRRSYEFFEEVYLKLYQRYHSLLPDSRNDKLSQNLVIIDSTTISLFKEILKGTGGRGLNGKRKGGVKVHMAIKAHENVPYLIRCTAGAYPDVSFLKELHLPKGSVVTMDRGYNSYQKLKEWNQTKVSWVTRLRNDTFYEVLKDKPFSVLEQQRGIIKDQYVKLGFKQKKVPQVNCRLITYYDQESKKELTFLTNNNKWNPSTVANIYRRRWQIELLFKRLKQNMPLHYFIGDNENAIKIQIYSTLIADFLLKLASHGLKRKWAFSNLASLVRLHLMNYTNLRRFLEKPDKCKISNPAPSNKTQIQLNLDG